MEFVQCIFTYCRISRNITCALSEGLVYLDGESGVTRWDGERNKSIYEKCGVETCTAGVKCGLVG